MKTIGRVESLWRYPVKSMRGESLAEAFAGFPGIYGDRFYAFVSSTSKVSFPWMTGRERQEMLLYTPAYRYPQKMVAPPNLAEAQALGPGVTAYYPQLDHFLVDIQTPAGESMPLSDPRLISLLRAGFEDDRHQLSLVFSHRSMTDCRPLSLISHQTIRQFSREVGSDLEPRQFRANLYMDLEGFDGFGEDHLAGRMLHIGDQAVLAVIERDPRCKMLTLHPDTAEANPEILKCLARDHDRKAGVYAAVVVEGIIRPGDPIVLAG